MSKLSGSPVSADDVLGCGSVSLNCLLSFFLAVFPSFSPMLNVSNLDKTHDELEAKTERETEYLCT